MLSEIEAGKIGTVIVKDMSRLGRDYLKVGFYTEIFFPQKGVRFIAVNNGIDSEKQQDTDFTPFLNIMKNIHYWGKWLLRIPIIRQTPIHRHIVFIQPAPQSGKIL